MQTKTPARHLDLRSLSGSGKERANSLLTLITKYDNLRGLQIAVPFSFDISPFAFVKIRVISHFVEGGKRE